MASSRKTLPAGIRETTKDRSVLEPPKRKVIVWTPTEKESVVASAVPLFKQMVDEGQWDANETRTWVRHLFGAAQDMVLPPPRRRPVKEIPFSNFAWFIDAVVAGHAAIAKQIEAVKAQHQEAIQEAEAKAARKPPSRELPEGKAPRKQTKKVRWDWDEQRQIIAEVWRILQEDPTRGMLSTVRKAQQILPPDRRRTLQQVHSKGFEWLFDGIRNYKPPMIEPEPEPEPALVELPAIQAPAELVELPADSGEEVPAISMMMAPMIALNRSVLQAMAVMMRDIRSASEAIEEIAKESRTTRRTLLKVVDTLDPGLLVETPTPAPTPSPTAPEAPEPPPEPPIPANLRPKIAVVCPHMSQVGKIREALEGKFCELRIYENGREARNKRFSNANYIICTSMCDHETTRHARSFLGPERVKFLSNAGIDTIIDSAITFAHKHARELEVRLNGANRVHG